jgi:carbamate kinase
VPVGTDSEGQPRRLAASPQPIGIVEADTVKRLVDGGTIVIAAGGGGPPVYTDLAKGWEGVDAIVDKDRTAALLAHALGADLLLILTSVDAVYRDYGKPTEQKLERLTVREAEQLIGSGQLGRGSMLPKVEAAVRFVAAGGKRAIIAALEDGAKAVRGEAGTTIQGSS